MATTTLARMMVDANVALLQSEGATIKARLLRQADAAHVQYAQYKDHWNDWTPVVVAKGQRSKSGQGFIEGDIVLMSPESYKPESGTRMNTTFRTCYSWRTGINTSIPEKYLSIP